MKIVGYLVQFCSSTSETVNVTSNELGFNKNREKNPQTRIKNKNPHILILFFIICFNILKL